MARGAAAIAAPDDSAVALFEDALATPRAERWPFDLARVRLAYGERARRTGKLACARVQLSDTLEIFEVLESEPWAIMATNALRTTGQTRARRYTQDDALTPQGHQIAMLAAAGLSNKEIGQRLMLSPRTVGGHLYRTFPKLGITSRAALRDALGPAADVAPELDPADCDQ